MNKYLRYLLTAVLLFGTLASSYMFVVFIYMPMFGLTTLSLMGTSLLMIFITLVMSISRFEIWFREKTEIKSSVYWSIIVGLIVLSIAVMFYGISVGGVEYTKYMSQQ